VVENLSKNAADGEFLNAFRQDRTGVSDFPGISDVSTPTADFDAPGGITTLLRRIVENFPVVPGKRVMDKAWTTKALMKIDSKLPPPSKAPRKAVYCGREGIPTLLYKIAATLGMDAPAERRENTILNLVKEAADSKDLENTISEFCSILDGAANVSAHANAHFNIKKQPEFKTANLILSAATACFLLACKFPFDGIPLTVKTGVASLDLNDSMTVRDALFHIQFAVDEAHSDAPLDLYELQTLLSGETQQEEEQEQQEQGDENGQQETKEKQAEKKIVAHNDMGAMENLVTGLLTRGSHEQNMTRYPEIELSTLHEMGFNSIRNFNRSLFADLSFLPSPEGVLEEIRKHARFALWPAVNEVYWKEGPLRRVRLLPLPTGRVRAAVEIEGDDALRVFLREIPRREDDEEWRFIVHNYTHEEARGYKDPICAAIEALRVCVVAKDRKIAPGAKRRVPTGLVRARNMPRKGDVVMHYVPRFIPLGGNTTGGTNSIPSVSLERKVGSCAVIGHLRQILQTHKASDECRAAAAAAGIPLPEYGQTFVRPHTRGDAEDIPLVKMRMSVSK
jgi:hypothetical protein